MFLTTHIYKQMIDKHISIYKESAIFDFLELLPAMIMGLSPIAMSSREHPSDVKKVETAE